MTPSEDSHDIQPDRRGSPLYERLAKIEEQLKLSERLVVIETEVERLIGDVSNQNKSFTKLLVDLELRIRSIERNLYIAAGVIVAADYLFRIFVK